MENYFYTICASGIICGLVKRLVSEKYREIINLCCSVIVIMTVLAPLQNIKNTPFDISSDIENKSDIVLATIYSDELKSELNVLLEDNEYKAKVENIYCECKEGEIEVLELIYSGDISAGDYLSGISGIARDRVMCSG